MCGGPAKPICPLLLLELAASNDLSSIKHAVEIDSESLAVTAPWYSRSLGPSPFKMGFADRSPLMIAALYGSTDVVRYIVSNNSFSGEVNRRSISDGATALHLAAAGGSPNSLDTIRLLIESSADVDALDDFNRSPADVIAKQTAKSLEAVLKATAAVEAAAAAATVGSPEKKKEYPPDLTLPDIKNGIYGTDEFRMYHFKVKPCSRAYSHDWTECPFVHPGENARRRDPAKFVYSCVPCPEFRKGSCRNGDNCEYAHGVFECWLHPAQYRTRLCKDETGCNRRVCFFAHKKEELRSVNPTAAAMMLSVSSPMSPSSVSAGMAGGAGVWMNQTPTTLQLPSSRLKATMSARDLDVDFELLGLEGYKQKLLDEIVGSPRAANWPGSPMGNQSLTQQLLSSYGNNLPSSQTVNSSSSAFGLDHSMAKAIMNARSAAFAQRSQSFVDRGAAARHQTTNTTAMSGLSDWGSPRGKVDWGVQGEELNKLRKSASFGLRNSQAYSPPRAETFDEPDVSWVHSLVKDGPANAAQRQQYHQMNGSNGDLFSPWGEEQMVA